MSIKHGVYGHSIPSTLLAPVQSYSQLPVVIGTAPVHKAQNPAESNRPIIVFSYEDFVDKFGYSEDFGKYTVCEAAYVFFFLMQAAPLVVINVLDTASASQETGTAARQEDGSYLIAGEGVMRDGLSVKKGETDLVLGTDYALFYNKEDSLCITPLSTEITSETLSLNVAYRKMDLAVDAADIIGAIDADTMKKTGIQAVDYVFSSIHEVPGMIFAPGYSHLPEVAAVMQAKCQSINGLFTARCILDLDCSEAKNYSAVLEWKNANGYTDPFATACWPMAEMDGKKLHLSTLFTASKCVTNYRNGDIPYESASNKSVSITRLVDGDGAAVDMELETANHLNALGVVTALNWIGGWRLWGNYTAAYPAATDPKDMWECVDSMNDFLHKVAVVTYWQEVDRAGKAVNIKRIEDSYNLWLNGLVSKGALVKGTVRFDGADLSGNVTYKVSWTSPLPMQAIVFERQFDSSAILALTV